MLKKRLIPCILLKNGRCVKGTNFTNFRDTGNPVTTSKTYNSQNADELIFLDITATNEGREPSFDIIRSVADECFMPITAGGGVTNVRQIREYLLAGADKVSINTAAVENPPLIEEGASIFGSQCIVASIDARKKGDFYEVYTHSGTRSTGIDAIEWARKSAKLGAGEILITSIDREGTKQGYDIDLVKQVSDSVDIPVIASGGAGNLQHLVDVIVLGNASAVSLSYILNFTDQNLIKMKAYMKNAGIEVRDFKF